MKASGAIRWLKVLKALSTENAGKLIAKDRTDKDLDPVRRDPAFKQFIASVGKVDRQGHPTLRKGADRLSANCA